MVRFQGFGRTNNQVATATLTTDPVAKTLAISQGPGAAVVIPYASISTVETNGDGDTISVHYASANGPQTATFSVGDDDSDALVQALKADVPTARISTNRGLVRLGLAGRTNNQAAAQSVAAARPRTNNQ